MYFLFPDNPLICAYLSDEILHLFFVLGESWVPHFTELLKHKE